MSVPAWITIHQCAVSAVEQVRRAQWRRQAGAGSGGGRTARRGRAGAAERREELKISAASWRLFAPARKNKKISKSSVYIGNRFVPYKSIFRAPIKMDL